VDSVEFESRGPELLSNDLEALELLPKEHVHRSSGRGWTCEFWGPIKTLESGELGDC
jgi:hypothetical protein